jgi:hypothetical protein
MSSFPNDYNRQNTPYQGVPYQGNPWQEQQDLREKKSGCGCWLWGCGCGCLTLILFIVVAGVGGYYVCFKGVSLTVSPETTVITEPLKNNGKGVDFFAALEKEYVPQTEPDTNGFKDVLAAYGKAVFENPAGEKREWQYEETCKKLDLNPAEEPAAFWKDYSEYFTGEADNVSKLASTPWKIDEQPKMKEWLDKVNPGLDILQKAVMKKHYFLPMVRRNENELAVLAVSSNALRFHRQLAESLRVRAMQRLGENKNAEAWKDINAALRLERLVFILCDYSEIENKAETQVEAMNHGNFESGELGESFSSLFTNNGELLNVLSEHSTWKKEELDRGIADLETLPPWLERSSYLKILQYAVLDIISSMNDVAAFSESFLSDSHPNKTKPGVMPFMNWGILAKQLNIKFDLYQKNIKPEDTQLLLLKTDKEVLEELNRKLKSSVDDLGGNNAVELISVKGRSVVLGSILGDILTASDIIILKQELNREAERQLLRAVLTVKRFQLEKKELPKTLEELKLKPLEPDLPLKFEITAEGISLTCGSQSVLLKK